MRPYCQHHLLLASYTWLLTATTCVSAQQFVHPSPVASRTVIYTPKKISSRFTNRRLQQEQARANADPFGQQRRLQETCGAIECCVDCVCCGPGTVWTGEFCVPNGDQNGNDSGASLFCDAIDIVLEGGCVDNPTCVGESCCGEGTKSVVDPTRDAEACYCVVDSAGQVDPPRSPRPTFSPTPGPRTPSPAGAQTPDPTTSPTLDATTTDPTLDPTLSPTAEATSRTPPTPAPRTRPPSELPDPTSSPTIRTRTRPPAVGDGDIDQLIFPELVGMEANEAQALLETRYPGLFEILILPEDAIITTDYVLPRIRLSVDVNTNLITWPPEVEFVFPELVGMEANEAQALLETHYPGLFEIFILPEDAIVTTDYVIHRIRIFVDVETNLITSPPRNG